MIALNAENVLKGRARTHERENKQVRVRRPIRRSGNPVVIAQSSD
jgi:hypothetical protein